MMKKYALCCILFALLLPVLTGCTELTVDTQNLEWHGQLTPLLREKSYTVHSQTAYQGKQIPFKITLAAFDGSSSHMEIAEDGEEPQEVYYTRSEENCFFYGLDSEHGIWIYQSVDDSDNYFYAYSVLERLQKLGSWIEQGELRYDKNTQCYYGENLTGSYACDGETHYVQSVEIRLLNGRVDSFSESYTLSANETAPIYCDTVRFTDIGLTQVALPANSISAEDLAAYGFEVPELPDEAAANE